MNWNMIKNLMITCIFVGSLLIGWQYNIDKISKLKNELQVSQQNLKKCQMMNDKLRIEMGKIIEKNQCLIIQKKQIHKPINIYSNLIKKYKLHQVKYMFKKRSNGSTLYCVDNFNNQVCYIDISSGIMVKTPETYWGIPKESKYKLVWKRK